MSLAKCSVSIEVNGHRDYYETIDEYIREERRGDIAKDVWAKMLETDTCIEVQVYPDTPIGFYDVVHYDLDTAIDMMLKLMKE